MKIRKTLIAALTAVICACMVAFAVACTQEELKTYTVSFDVKGHGTAPASITEVAEGSLIEKPADPVAEGFVFMGWFKDSKCTDDWDFETDAVYSDVVLVALWDTQKYTVSFDVKGHGTAPAAITDAEKGAAVQKPEDPSAEGFVFEGWYKDDGLTQAWNFATDKVDGNATLYACWKQVYPVSYTEQFNREIDGAEYFSVAHTGSYLVNVTVDGGNEGDSVDYLLDGETKIAVLNGAGAFSEAHYLEAGTHKLASKTQAYAAKVTLNGLDTPFTEAIEFFGDKYRLRVTSLGADSYGDKENIASIRFGEVSETIAAATAIDFDGECYTLSAQSLNGSIYEYYQVKICIHFHDGKVISIDVFEKTGDSWSTQPDDVLEVARTAEEVSVFMNTNGENTGSVQKTFEYVYFTLLDNKLKWLEFSGVAEGTEFYLVDVGASRTGDISPVKLNILNPGDIDDDYKGIRLADEDSQHANYNHLAVKPAPGQTTVSFSVRELPPPPPKPGSSEDNPVALAADEPAVLKKCANDTSYWFTFTPEEAGKYVMQVYYESSDGTKYKVQRCNVDKVMDYLPFTMPSVEELLAGKEVTLKAMTYNFSVLLGGAGGTLTVSIEKVKEAVGGALTAGTYTGTGVDSSYNHEFTFVIDESNNVAITQNRTTLDGSPRGTYNCDPTPLTDNGDGSYSVTVRLSSFFTFTFRPNADGSLAVSDGDHSFTATKQ